MNNGLHSPPVPRGMGAVPDVDDSPRGAEDTAAPPAPFPLGSLPPVAHAMAEAVGAAVRVPASLAGPVALGLLSASVGAGLRLESGPGRHVRANLYLLPSAASGSGKSEALRLLAAPLLAREREAVEAHRRDVLPTAKADTRLLAGDIQRIEKAAAKAADAHSRQLLRDELADKERELAAAEAATQTPVFTVEDVTTERLAVLLARRRETLFSLSSDAGSVINNVLGRYNRTERTDETLYLKSWTGEAVRVDRMGREPVVLHQPCLAALWLVQPDKTESLLAVQALSDGGLLPRFLLCHSGCEPQEMTDDAPTAAVPAQTSTAWADLVRALLETWHEREGEPALVRPTGAAHALFREHFNASVRRYHAGELRDVNAFRARWTEQGWRIALCLHAGHHGAEAAGWSLDEDTARAALTLADWFAGQQLAILAKGRTERRLARLEGLCARLAGYGGSAPLRDLEKSNGFDPAEVRALALAFPGRVRVEERAAGARGGRPSPAAVLVPGTARK